MRLSCLCLKVGNLSGIMYVRFLTFDTDILKMYKIEISEVSDYFVDILILSSLKKWIKRHHIPFKITFAAVDKL